MKAWMVPVAAAAMLVLTISWYAMSPWMTLYGIKSAVERRDVEALIGYVDFDALRANLKDQVHAVAAARRQKLEAANTSGWSLPQDRASAQLAMIDGQIDTYITAENLRGAAVRAGPSRPQESSNITELAKDIAIDHEGLSTFVVRGRTTGKGFGVVFTNHGLSWKVSGVRVPGEIVQSIGSGNRPFAW